MERLLEREIEAAAEWWANAPRGEPAHDNGDPFQSIFARQASKIVGEPTEEQLQVFKTTLIDLLRQDEYMLVDMKRPKFGCYFRVLACDYGPGKHLGPAAEAAKISDLRFPCKTVMWIDPGLISVAKGYGAPIMVVWTKNLGVA